MERIQVYFVVLLISISIPQLNAQSLKEEPDTKSTPTLEKEAIKARERRNEVLLAKKKQESAKSAVEYVSPVNEDDIYMGRKAEFLGNLTVSELPSDFPKYDKSYGMRYYNNLVDNFYSSHMDILKPAVRQKMEHSFPTNHNQQFNTK